MEAQNEIVIRAVQESNWQEGIYLDRGRTRELAYHVFEDMAGIEGPHLDIQKLLKDHQKFVVRLKRRKTSVNEIAASNLSAAHLFLSSIVTHLMVRSNATFMYALREMSDTLKNDPSDILTTMKKSPAIIRGLRLVDKLLASTDRVPVPTTQGVETEGKFYESLLRLDFKSLLHPMNINYIHFLHRIVMMGIADPRKCGVLRKRPVWVGNPEIQFPVPAMVPEMMQEFCRDFPFIMPSQVKYDPVLMAAKISHRFVAIHPYSDGNGRVSRLLMNLVLWGIYPPVYLKADKKGRHRYAQALTRADRGNIKPLACLICLSLNEIYERLIRSSGNIPASSDN